MEGATRGEGLVDPYTLAEVDQWLDWIHWKHDEFDYRHIYFAYLAVRIGQPRSGEVTMTIDPDGSCLLRAGGGDRGIRLATDGERAAFVDHVRRRYCGDRYPSMREWEAARHAGYLEDRWWSGT